MPSCTGDSEPVNPERVGTKVAAHFQATVPPGEAFTVRVRFSNAPHDDPFGDFDAIFDQRIAEADQFYAALQGRRSGRGDSGRFSARLLPA